ncbi:hypothetical protein EW146_g8506 [Bondarzewia mesenterica]|uniref:Cytochrome P450 n=1 Tax=Bondarzewia mesenterica TaxID=1095465 RepID=A0A4S4LFQ9_9AGAM|nr:hypothetical protein EW146_g8506 [Bondarzewia mesenterica]
MSSGILVKLVLAFSTAVLAHYLFKLARRLAHPYFSPLRDVKGPQSKSMFFGNLREIDNAEAMELHERWREDYGPVYKYKAFFNVRRNLRAAGLLFVEGIITQRLEQLLLTCSDFLLQESSINSRYESIESASSYILGINIYAVFERTSAKDYVIRDHQSPAFGPSQVRELTEIFVDKAIQLRDIWVSQLSTVTSDGSERDRVKIDVSSWLNKMTLDVIGLAGFNYSFNALNPDGKPNELNESVQAVFRTPRGFRAVLPVLQTVFPPLRVIPSERKRTVEAAQRTMARIGNQLLAERKAAVLASINGNEMEVGRKSVQGKDLLSLLVKANMATDLPETARLDDADVLAQVPTFLVAGHETTRQAPSIPCAILQIKLRAELLLVPSQTPTMEELDRLPYLDAVVRETMRVFSPVPNTVRVANCDDVIPLETEWEDKHGVRRKEVRPERWENPPAAIQSIPGIWGNSLAFSGGSRACIGYRFSVIEMKALIFVLIRAFQFEMSVPLEEIKSKSVVVRRPYLASEPEKGAQLPLWVSAARLD